MILLAVVPAAPVWRRWVRGQGLVEYGLILALTTLFTVVVLMVFGGTLADFLDFVGDAIDSATGT
jgi:Flp pilus assembly pilin Flp